MLPTCLTSDYVANVDLCQSSSDCFSDLKSFTLTKFMNGNNFRQDQLTILGLAKDGHLIIGPYING